MKRPSRSLRAVLLTPLEMAVTETLAPCDQYTLETEAFSKALRGEIPLPYGLDDAVMNMRIIDALFRSEKSSRFEEV